MKLAKEIWKQHVEVFDSFDLVCHNGSSLQDETMSNALFNALITLERMREREVYTHERNKIDSAINYLKRSKYYSEANSQSDY